MKARYLLSIFSALTISVAASGCSHDEPSKPQAHLDLPVATVSIATAETAIAPQQVELVGTVQAVDQAEISAKITGSIVKLPVELGSQVAQGALLVELSAGEISAQVQQAKAQLEQAKRNLAREEKLLAQSAATRETVKSMRDAVAIAEAAYKEAGTMLDYAQITAPFAGIITRKLASVGDLATPGKPLLNIEKESKLQVITDIPEAMLLRINKGDVLPVRIPSVNLTLDGVVAEVSPIADPSSRTAPIKLNVPANSSLRSGQFARIAINISELKTITVPEEALTRKGQLEFVYVATGDNASMRLVRSGKAFSGKIEILSGLQEGEQVILSDKLITDGQPIKIL